MPVIRKEPASTMASTVTKPSDTKSILDEKTFKHAIFRRGTKEELFRDDDGQSDDGAIPEDVSGDEKLPQLHQLWSLERKGKDLSAAIWRPERCAAELVIQKGKLFAHIGSLWAGKTYLTIEEAVYMVDRGSMLLFREDEKDGKKKVLLTLKECYGLMASCGVSVDHLGCFAKLLRAGYVAHRFGVPMTVRDKGKVRGMTMEFVEKRAQTGADDGVDKKRRWGGNEEAAAAGTVNGANSDSKSIKKGKLAKMGETGCETTHEGVWWPAYRFRDAASSKVPPAPCEIVPNNMEKKEAKRKQFPNLRPLLTYPEADFVEKHEDERRSFFYLDVYPPNGNFSRKNTGKKAALLSIIANGKVAAPQQSLLRDIDAEARAVNVDAEQTPTRFCSLEHGDIAFYSLIRTNIRDIH